MAKLESARVAASTGSWYRLITGDGSFIKARLKGKLRLGTASVTNPVAVGDNVSIERNKDGTASIVHVEERENVMIRQSTHRKMESQILAANLDLGIVVQSFRQPKYKHGFIDRFLVTCEAYHIPALIVINKNDLDPEELKERALLVETYKTAGYEVLFTAVSDPESIKALNARLAEKTTLFMGQSGVGKSSLLNALAPELDRKIGEISTFNEKGKHTTTHAEMLPIAHGGFVIDTPGLREFGLAGFEPHEISYYFPEMASKKQSCQYQNCLCIDEPDCPVQKAYEEGLIPHSRMDSFLQIVESLQEQK